jgi:hypothetical protein
MQAGEVGVFLQVFPNPTPAPANPINLTGSTCVLAVQAPSECITTLAMQVSSDGTYAYRYTLATDFPYGGSYTLQLIATFPTQEFKSPQQVIQIYDSLV